MTDFTLLLRYDHTDSNWPISLIFTEHAAFIIQSAQSQFHVAHDYDRGQFSFLAFWHILPGSKIAHYVQKYKHSVVMNLMAKMWNSPGSLS